MHVVVFTRSSVDRALASTPICCSILQYTKSTKPSADTWAIDPWVRVVPSFLCASLFQSVCVRRGDDVFLVATWNSCVIYQVPHASTRGLLGRPTSLWNHLLHACRYWYCGCHPKDTAVGRDRTHYSFSSIRAVVYGFSTLAIWAASWLVYDVLFLCSHLFFTRLVWYVHTRRTWYEAKQGCDVVSCSYWGACWFKVRILMYMMYVREDCYFWFFIEIFHILSR